MNNLCVTPCEINSKINALTLNFGSQSPYMRVHFKSPIGTIHIESSDIGIRRLIFIDEDDMTSSIPSSNEMSSHPEIENEITSLVIQQLNEYFAGSRRAFDMPLDLQGTPFQKRVWQELLKIPFGTTISYKELALRLGDVKTIRAAGTANGANPVSIIVPCHRVIGSDGSLIGYGGGIWRKKWLLEHEKLSNVNGQLSIFE